MVLFSVHCNGSDTRIAAAAQIPSYLPGRPSAANLQSHLIHSPLRPREFASQTASRSVHPFFVVLTDMPNRQAHIQSMHATPRRLQQKHASRWCDAAFNAPCVRRSLHVYDDNSQTQHCTHILALILLFLRELIQHCIWHTVGLLHLSYETFLSAQMTTTSTSDAVIPVSCKILLKTISTT